MRRNFGESYVKSVRAAVGKVQRLSKELVSKKFDWMIACSSSSLILFFQVKSHVCEYKPQVAQVLCAWGSIECGLYVNSLALAYCSIQAIFKRITGEKSLTALNFNVVLHNYCFAAPNCQNRNRQNC